MEINYLKEFVVLAQTGNFMEAADILYSSQSTLSKHIKSIESELGVSLFDRTTRKVAISKYGQLFLPYASQIIELRDQYTAILKSSIDSDYETLNLGSVYGLAQYHITDVLVCFKKSRSQSTLNVMQSSTTELTEMLRQRKCELAFIRDIEDEEDEFVKIPYQSDTIVAVLPINHPLAGEKTIPLQMLEKEHFLLEVPDTMPYLLSIKACKLSGFEPKVVITNVDREYLIDLVSQGMGVSLMLKQILLHFSNPKITLVDVTPNVTTQIFLCYPKGAKLSEAAKHFVQCTEALKN
jgi:LysR family transcriptional activator of glutamate synthase operon